MSDPHLSEISGISRDSKKRPNEIALCKLNAGQYIGGHVLPQADYYPQLQQVRAVTLYTLKNSYFLVISKEKYRRAVETCRNRVKTEKLDFLKDVELIK